MANNGNLVPTNTISKEEARERGRLGGKKSAETRKKKKKLKDAMGVLLELPISEKNKETLQAMGIDDSEMNNQMLIAVSAFQRALKGDVRAMEFIANTMGGKSMNDLDKAMMKRVKAETERIKAETKKIQSTTSGNQFDADKINEMNHDILSNVAPTRKLEDFE